MLARLSERFTLQPDLARAVRTSLAMSIPLVICHALHLRAEAIFMGMAAQTIALPDLRGAYGLRLGILATMSVVVALSGFSGVLVGHSVAGATLAMGVLALLGGVWRHVSADYGPPLSVASVLLFLLGLSQPGTLTGAARLGELILLGSAAASVVHVIYWAVRPQHPLRQAVAESWIAASDLLASMRAALGEKAGAESVQVPNAERALRAALDESFRALTPGKTGALPASLLTHLEEMRREVVHFSMAAVAFHSALESSRGQPDFARHLPTVDSVLKTLADAARSIAITLITHRPENFHASELRLQRCQHLIAVLRDELASSADAPTLATLARIAHTLPALRTRLGETIDRSGPQGGRFSLPTRLPELGAQSVQSLAAWINPAPQLDPVLLRYSLRMALLTMLAVALYKGFEIPRGYWIAFTIVVVLQPDYGSTRQRAGERIGGTLAGSLLGSAFLWIKLPLPALDLCIAALSFAFGFFLKRRYDIAVFFVTLLVVLITETISVVHLDFTVARFLCSVLGGGVALVSALVFWPVWESEKFTALLAAAIRANRTYLQAIASWLAGESTDRHALLMAKRGAENADRFAAASLQRLLAEPRGQAEALHRAAALTTYNQRVTRALTAAAVHLREGAPMAGEVDVCLAARQIGAQLEVLAHGVEQDHRECAELAAKAAEKMDGLRELLFAREPEGGNAEAGLIRTQLAKSITEIRAMTLAMQ